MLQRGVAQTACTVSAIGLGCMGFSEYLQTSCRIDATETINHALNLGVSLLDTADIYGRGDNEELVGRAIHGRRDQVFLATKFGICRDSSGRRWFDSRPSYARQALQGSLHRLRVDYIDLYYLHRYNPTVPIEDIVGTMGEFVEAGLVRHLGLSKVDGSTLRRAHGTYPIVAMQSEYSLLSRHIEKDVLPTVRELGLALFAYSPLCRGLLAGTLSSITDLSGNDLRTSSSWFKEKMFADAVQFANRLRNLATEFGCTSAQLALAWLLAQGTDVIPIPGADSVAQLDEDVAAITVELGDAERTRIAQLLSAQEQK